MNINLGKLIDTEVRGIVKPKTTVLARVKWTFEKGELKWGTIATSIKAGEKFWVQMPKFYFSMQGKMGWITPFLISDKELEAELVNAALKKFTGLSSIGENQEVVPDLVDDDEINLDDLPF